MTVRFIGTIGGDPQTVLGTIRWDGAGWHVAPSTPDDEVALREILETPIQLRGRQITKATPDAFCEAMTLQYRGIGLRGELVDE
jgi:hypothetical protein